MVTDQKVTPVIIEFITPHYRVVRRSPPLRVQKIQHELLLKKQFEDAKTILVKIHSCNVFVFTVLTLNTLRKKSFVGIRCPFSLSYDLYVSLSRCPLSPSSHPIEVR